MAFEAWFLKDTLSASATGFFGTKSRYLWAVFVFTLATFLLSLLANADTAVDYTKRFLINMVVFLVCLAVLRPSARQLSPFDSDKERQGILVKSFFANCLIIALLAAYLYGIIWYVDGLSQKSVATQFMFTPGFGLLHLFVISAFVAFSAMQVFELRRSTGAIGVVVVARVAGGHVALSSDHCAA